MVGDLEEENTTLCKDIKNLREEWAIDLEEENTMLREAIQNYREENKYLKERIAKLTTAIQNKIEEGGRISVSLNEKEELRKGEEENVRGAHKSLEPLMSLEETSLNPSSSASTDKKEKEDHRTTARGVDHGK